MSAALARQVLHRMPQEVFDVYIEPLVRVYGWHFQTEDASAAFTAWRGILGGQSLKCIANLSWKRQELTALHTAFHPDSKFRVGILIGQNMKGQAIRTNIADTKARFLKARRFIARTAKMPTPPVLMRTFSGYLILDGHHRIAAMLSLSPSAGFTFRAWVGSK